MAGPHILAAVGAQGQFAGNTSPGGGQAPPPPVTTAPEAFNLSMVGTELEHMLSGGIHPESLFQPVSRVLEQATSSVVGPHGGMVPRPNSAQAPGPAGEGLAARGRAILARIGIING